MQVGEMQRLLDEAGIYHRDCFERGELLQRLGENEGRLQGDLKVWRMHATFCCEPGMHQCMRPSSALFDCNTKS